MSRHGTSVPMPPPELRSGHAFTAESFVASGVREAERVRRLGATAGTRLLDLGCGVGRLAIGLLTSGGPLPTYTGVDVNATRVAWCAEHLAPLARELSFVHVDVANTRYNPDGSVRAVDVRFPGGPFDAVYAFSVFSHMAWADTVAYLRAVRGIVAPGAWWFLTAYVEPDVPVETENPPGFVRPWTTPLECVRLQAEAFERAVADAGWRIESVDRHAEVDNQSGFVLRVDSARVHDEDVCSLGSEPSR